MVYDSSQHEENSDRIDGESANLESVYDRLLSRRRFVGGLGVAGLAGVSPVVEAKEKGRGSPPEKQDILAPNLKKTTYWERLLFSCLQGIANQNSSRIYNRYPHTGSESWYSEVEFSPPDRSVFYDWYGQYEHLSFREFDDPYSVFDHLDPLPFNGYVIVDEDVPVTANIAANYASTERLLPVTHDLLAAGKVPDSDVVYDLRGEFQGVRFGEMTRIEAYEWAFNNQWPETNHARAAVLGTPDPQSSGQYPVHDFYTANSGRDYTVAEGGFFFDLASTGDERELKDRILDSMDLGGYVFGWHTPRNGEHQHISHLSQNGQLSIGASTVVGNFSFHSRVDVGNAVQRFKRTAEQPPTVESVDDKIYLTFVQSDGDSLNFIMRHALGGLWQLDQRGEIPLGWEIQPLLADIGPGLLDYFQATATENDHFQAGLSGIGYFFPGQVPRDDLQELLSNTRDYLGETGLSSLSVSNSDKPLTNETIRLYNDVLGEEITGAMRGYTAAPDGKTRLYGSVPGQGRGNKRRIPTRPTDPTAWLPTALPVTLGQSVDQYVDRLESLADARSQRPLFVPIHYHGHSTTLEDLAEVNERLDSELFEIVGPSELFTLFSQARPGSVVFDPPETTQPSGETLVSGESHEITKTLLGFGDESIPVTVQATMTASTLENPLTAEVSTEAEVNKPTEITHEFDIPSAAGVGDGKIEYDINDGTSASLTAPVNFIPSVDTGGPVQRPYTTYASTEAEFAQSEQNFFIIRASGRDVGGGYDDYGAIYNTTVQATADCTAIVKVESQEHLEPFSKAGIMIRNDITDADNSTGYVTIEAMDGTAFLFQWDDDDSGTLSNGSGSGKPSYPCWLKLEKNGTTFTGSYSSDGENWTEVHTQTVPSANEVQDVGIFSTSHKEGVLGRAIFSNLDITNG